MPQLQTHRPCADNELSVSTISPAKTKLGALRQLAALRKGIRDETTIINMLEKTNPYEPDEGSGTEMPYLHLQGMIAIADAMHTHFKKGTSSFKDQFAAALYLLRTSIVAPLQLPIDLVRLAFKDPTHIARYQNGKIMLTAKENIKYYTELLGELKTIHKENRSDLQATYEGLKEIFKARYGYDPDTKEVDSKNIDRSVAKRKRVALIPAEAGMTNADHQCAPEMLTLLNDDAFKGRLLSGEVYAAPSEHPRLCVFNSHLLDIAKATSPEERLEKFHQFYGRVTALAEFQQEAEDAISQLPKYDPDALKNQAEEELVAVGSKRS